MNAHTQEIFDTIDIAAGDIGFNIVQAQRALHPFTRVPYCPECRASIMKDD